MWTKDSILFARPVGCQYEAEPSGDPFNPSVRDS